MHARGEVGEDYINVLLEQKEGTAAVALDLVNHITQREGCELPKCLEFLNPASKPSMGANPKRNTHGGA